MSSAVSVRSNSSRGPLGRFFMTTALVTLGLTAFGASSSLAQQVRVLNNGEPPVSGTATQESGEWASGSRIWSNPNNPDNRDELGTNAIGRLPVLVPGADGTIQPVVLTIPEEIELLGLRIEGNGYSLRGDGNTKRGALRSSDDDSALSFDMRNGSEFEVTDVALEGFVLATGDGKLIYSGDTGSQFDRLKINSDASFDLVAGSHLQGRLENEGIASLSGQVDGTITNKGTMELVGAFQADSLINNDSGQQLTIADGATVKLGSGSGRGINNSGTTNILGRVEGQVRNDDGGKVVLSGGSVRGITNRQDGDGEISGFGSVTYGLHNYDGKVIVKPGLDPADNTLHVGGQLNNAGRDASVEVEENGILRVDGGIANKGTIVSRGQVVGDITNENRLETYASATNGAEVQGDVVNSRSSSTWVAEGVTVEGDLTNAGTTNFTNVTQTGDVTNSRTFNVADSSVSGAVRNTGQINLGGTTGNSFGSLTNSGNGRIEIDGNDTLRITNGSFTNSATGENNVAIRGTVVGNVTNTGTMNIGNTGPNATATITGDVTNGILGQDRKDSVLRVTGVTQVNGNLTNHGTITSFNKDGVREVEVHVSEKLINRGVIQSDPGDDRNSLTIYADIIENRGDWLGNVKYYGELWNGGNVNLNKNQKLDYKLTNLDDGTVNVTANIDADSHAIDNDGEFNIRNSGNLSSVNPFRNTGQLTIDRNGQLVATRLVNTGTIDSSGTISGPFNNKQDGTADLSGSVTGVLTNTGVVNTKGNLTVSTIINKNQMNVRDNHTLSSSNPIRNGGTLYVEGTINAALNNTNRTNLSGGILAGKVDNTGTIAGNGRIRGELDNFKDATLRVSGGTLTTDKTVNNRGTVELAHTLVGDITNIGGGKINMLGQREDGVLVSGVRGNVANRGEITGIGRITGNLTNRGNATATIGGSVGTINNHGTSTLTSAGELSAGNITNGVNANVVVGAGSRLSTDNGLINNGSMTVTGTLDGAVTNAAGATTTFSGQGARNISDSISNAGTLTGNGTVSHDVINEATGNVTMTGTIGRDLKNSGTVAVTAGRLNVRGTVLNDHRVMVSGGVLAGNVHNRSQLTVSGGVTDGGVLAGNVTNDANLRSNGIIQGNVENTERGQADLRGVVTGTIINDGTVDTLGNLRIGGLTNNNVARVNAGHILTTTGPIRNRATLIVNGIIRRVTAAGTTNVARAPGDVELINESVLSGSGTIDMNIRNEGTLRTTGTIRGYVDNIAGGIARISGRVAGSFTNAGRLNTTGDLNVGSLVTSQGGRSTVTAGHTLTARGNGSNAGLTTVAGTFDGSMLNEASGTFDLTGGEMTGDLLNNGAVNAHGTIGGTVENNSSNFNLTGDLGVGGFINNSDLTIAAGRNLRVATDGVYANTATTTLAGRLTGAVENAEGAHFNLASTGVVAGTMVNDGTLNARFGRITGILTNNNMVDMHGGSGGSATTDVLRVGGLAGSGTYSMSLNLEEMTADRIEVRGGGVTGAHHFAFRNVRPAANEDLGGRITILDVDDAFSNNYSFTASGINASERIVYRLIRDTDGDLVVTSGVNPAIGATLGNIMLAHSLIGTVINRPTSPYVVGMAYEDKEKPCGVGSWARAMGGNATANGAVSGPGATVNTEIKADYYGMQVGTDLACFDGHFDGWDMAVGGIFGVNRGSTTQPIPNITTDSPDAGIASVTKSDFDQIYGGIYLTASKDRWTLDVQYRYEKTDFDLENTPIEGIGLGLIDNKFSSTANTLAGAVSYSMPIAETGWTLVPQAGFAWSKYKIDDMRFTEGYRMEFGSAERKVGFFGATVTKTFVQPSQNSAFNLFGTATYYNDFADDTVSIFKRDVGDFKEQRLTADNLGSYTEVSIGSNYIKVLPRVSGRPRQFSAGARIDGRFGDNIDSVGVTGQFRLQF